ncbi:peptidyl-prolyl cis-trans isomerase [Gracilimonas tropica]|uniref:peptidyl-prolyl cis-trans isomerase n=1 Tax=Gracilimonas tropica TaxID=454600 RepID=UPI000379AE9A|nr:peptidyl-prolyl cis-trans isomerase [Gracilimonas tropica]
MIYSRLFITSLLVMLLVAACSKPKKTDTTVLAEVGPTQLTTEEALHQIPAVVLQSDSLSALQQYRDDWIRRQLILQEADRLNFTSRPGMEEKLRRMREEFILQQVQDYIISEFEEDLSVSEQEARDYYQQHKDRFVLDERYVRYRHLVAASNAEAESAKRELMQGIDWETVARKYSKYAELKIRESERYWPISVAGSDIRMLNRYLQIIGPSEISPTYRTGGEYHFVQLLDERPEGDHPDLDWLIGQIKEWLTLEKRKRAFNTYVKNLYLQGQANNEIKIHSVIDGQTNQAVMKTDTLNTPYNE